MQPGRPLPPGTPSRERLARSILSQAILLACVSAGLGATAPAAFAQAAAGPAMRSAARYDIPAGTLDQVLNRFAAQAGILLAIDGTLTAGKSSAGLSGDYGLQDGFRTILISSGLEAVAQPSGGYSLRKAAQAITPAASATGSQGEALLSAVRVTAPADRGGATEGTGSYTTRSMNTATGLALSPRETPQSVSVITHERIEDQVLDDLVTVLRNTPGVSVNAQDRGRSEYVSRGFSITNFSVDGVPTLSTGGIWGDTITTALYDRAEAVRGANGLQSGAGNPGASINLVRKRADSKTFTGHVTLEGGSWNRYGGTADLSTPLNSDGSVRGRAVVSYRDQDSFMDFEGKQTTVYYLALDADLSNATRLSFGASDQRDDRDGVYWGGLPLWYADGARAHWDRSKTTAPKWSYWNIHRQSVFTTLEHHLDSGWSLKADAEYAQTYDKQNMLWTSGQPDRETGLGMRTTPYLYDKKSPQTRFSVQASGPFDFLGREHEMTVGAVHARNKYALYMPNLGNSAPVGNFNQWDGNYPEPIYGAPNFNNSTRETQTAAYAAVRLNPADPLKIIAGGRLTRFSREDISNRGASFSELNEPRVFTPYIGALYDLNDWLTAYASYTSIFQPQGNRNRSGRTLDPLEGNSYETGLKGEFLGGALTTSAALFRIQQDNFAVRDGDEVVAGTADPAYRSEKGVKSEGYELEVTGDVLPNWNLSLSYAYASVKDRNGVRINTRFASRMLKLFTKYELTGALSGLSLGGGIDWKNDMPLFRPNPVTSVQEDVGQSAYALLNLMARYQISQPLSVQVNVYNLLDKKYYESSWNGSFTYGEPRRVLLTMDYKF